MCGNVAMQAAEVDRLGGTEGQHSNHSQAIPSVKFSSSLPCFSACACVLCVRLCQQITHTNSPTLLGPWAHR